MVTLKNLEFKILATLVHKQEPMPITDMAIVLEKDVAILLPSFKKLSKHNLILAKDKITVVNLSLDLYVPSQYVIDSPIIKASQLLLGNFYEFTTAENFAKELEKMLSEENHESLDTKEMTYEKISSLSKTSKDVLKVILDNEGLSIKEIQGLVHGVSNSHVTTTVRKLYQLNIVRRSGSGSKHTPHLYNASFGTDKDKIQKLLKGDRRVEDKPTQSPASKESTYSSLEKCVSELKKLEKKINIAKKDIASMRKQQEKLEENISNSLKL